MQEEYVKRMSKSTDVMVLDSDSDDGQTDSDNEFLLDDWWDEWMANWSSTCMYMTFVSNCDFLIYFINNMILKN